MKTFTIEEAERIGNILGIDWKEVGIEEFKMGLNVELEHGTRYPEINVTNDDEIITGKIAWAHLKEYADYYTRLNHMEKEAEAFWHGSLMSKGH